MSGTEDQDSAADSGGDERSGRDDRPGRLDRRAIEAKWRERWGERPRATPVRRLSTDPPPLELHLRPRGSDELEEEPDEEHDEDGELSAEERAVLQDGDDGPAPRRRRSSRAEDGDSRPEDSDSRPEDSDSEASEEPSEPEPDGGETEDETAADSDEPFAPFDLSSGPEKEPSATAADPTTEEISSNEPLETVEPAEAAASEGSGDEEERAENRSRSGRGRRSRGGRERRERAPDVDGERPFYCLDMFPYPSTHGFSVNQLRGIAVTDVVARYQTARGRQVFRPLGWDSFGVGIEQEAQSLGVTPAEVVEHGVSTMRDQLVQFGAMVDWDAELRTSDPSYYRWTQWLFLKLHEEGLAVREETPMKWCDQCRMNLANEEVSEGTCVHCGGDVEERNIPQWKVRTTEFADRLHQGLRHLKWPPRVKALQRNWIGRREGFVLTLKARSEFQEEVEEFEIFTRRLEVVSECTFVVLAPEHPLIDQVCDELYEDEVAEYREKTSRLTERERLATQGHPDGVPTGAWALNPVTLQPMPIWVSASVLPQIRLGAILAHPPSDPRLSAFAEHFRIAQHLGESSEARVRKKRRRSRSRRKGGGESGVGELRRRVRSSLDSRGLLESRTDYHLRDWVFARQRYWGEPIPIVHCLACGEVPVPESELPVELPELSETPEGKNGESPLAQLDDWRKTTCPQCEGPAERETDTMPQWAASGWYYLRYLNPNDSERLVDSAVGDRWLPVNLCVGGIEHAILHLLYVRFFSYFFHDLGLTDREEPFRRLFNQGRIRSVEGAPSGSEGVGSDPRNSAEDHRGPRIAAGPFMEKWGADALRLHLLFLSPPDLDTEWDENGLRGCARFLNRSYEAIVDRVDQGKFVSRRVLVLKHRLIRRVTRAIRTFHLNKAVSAFMAFVKELRDPDLTKEEVDRDTLKAFVILLQPFAPFLAAELWEKLGETGPLESEPWPEYSDELLRPVEVEIAVLVDGRIVDRLVVDPDVGKTELLHQIEERPKVRARTKGRRADRVIVVPERLVHLIFSKEEDASESPDREREGAEGSAPASPDRSSEENGAAEPTES